MLNVRHLRVNLRREPLSVDDPAPLFSWAPESDRAGATQAAYRIVVKCGEDTVWDTDKVDSDETLNIAYAGEALKPLTRYTWTVSVWDDAGERADSAPAMWRTGYMGKPWTAGWISPDPTGTTETSAQMRRVFTLPADPADAVACVYSPGWYDFFVNGKKADDRVLSPTAVPDDRCAYDTYDITAQLHKGKNAIGLWMGDGYNQRFVKWGWRYDNVKRAIAELRITYADGKQETIMTDGKWMYTMDTPVISNGVYDGEYYDARKETPWCDPDYPAEGWSAAVPVDYPKDKLEPCFTPRIRVVEYTAPKTFWRNQAGNLILDFGQNRAGWVRFRVSGKAGQVISVHTSEEVDHETKELDPFTNRSARSTDTYVLKGEGVEEYEPRFTYHGFRYAEVIGFEGDPAPDNFCAATVHTDMPFTGTFHTDDEDVNRLYSNVRWGIRSNAYAYPTDCPMRNERTPCLHDVVVYSDVASFIWDVSSYWKNFLLNSPTRGGNPGWDGATITMAWHQYNFYGDKRLLETMYPNMIAMLRNFEEKWPDYISDRFFGDWCAPKDNADGGYDTAFSYVPVTSTALWYYQVKEMLWIARALEKSEDIPWLEGLLPKIAAAYHEKFYDPEHHCYDEGEQTAGALPLYFGMVPEDKKTEILQSVVDGLARKDNHVDTGIYGTKYLPLMLADYGKIDLALDAFFQPTYPSYGYEFLRGATTIWEQFWERGGMSSHNHGMFSGGATCLFRNLLGFYDSHDACRHMVIKPTVSRRIHELAGSVVTVRGAYLVSYTRDEETMRLTVTVPFGCTADVLLPDGGRHTVTAGKHEFEAKVK